VDGWFEPDMSVSYNVSGRIQNKTVDKFIGQNSIVKKAIKTVSPKLAESVTQNQNLKKWVNKLRKKNLEKAPLSKELKAKMFDSIYREEIEKLQDLLERDLSKWLNSEKPATRQSQYVTTHH
jgi:uncharacterized membrane-anchored protein YjiN (DUF445 family)